MRDPRIRIREIADLLDLAERAAQRVVADLSKARYVDLVKEGHQKIYSITTELPFHLPCRARPNIKALGLLREAQRLSLTSSPK